MTTKKAAEAAISRCGAKIQYFQETSKENSEIPIYGLSPEIQGIIAHYADAYECSRDITAAAVFSAVAALLGKKVYIKYQQIKDYTADYICIVAPSGSNKTSPVTALLRPINAYDARQYDNYCLALREWQKNHDKKDSDGKPTPHQTIIGDSTPEALFSALRNNGNGVLLYADEIRTFLSNLDRYNSGDSSPILLSVWSNNTIVINRKTDGEGITRIEEPCLSILGGIQPRLLQRTYGKYNDGSGFLSRWLFFYPSKPYREIGDKIELNARYSHYWEQVCDWLHGLSEKQIELTEDAKEVLNSFIDSRKLIMRNEDIDPDEAEYYGKSQIHIWRLLVLCHVLGGASLGRQITPYITKDEVVYAMDLMAYFERCACRVLETMSQRQAGKMRAADLLRAVNERWPITNVSLFADCIGVSKQYVSKVLLNREST